MTTPTARILIVEDEVIIAANLSLILTGAGHEVIGMLHQGEAVLPLVRQNEPDIVLLDINLQGEADGIAIGRRLRAETHCSLIYLTANSDDETFARARANAPEAFLTKPFNDLEVLRAVSLAAARRPTSPPAAAPYKLSDRLFVRHRERMTRLLLEDVLFVKADRNYCQLQSQRDSYVLTIPLKRFASRLPPNFVRVHRSYLVNILHVTEVDDHGIKVGNHPIPLSRNHRDDFLARIDTV